MSKGRYLKGGKWQEIDLPLVPEPVPEQVLDVRHLTASGHKLLYDGKRALFNEPGTGKTLTAIWAYRKIQRYAPRLLVIGPGNSVRNWIRWILAVLKYPRIQLMDSSTEAIDKHADCVVVTYGMLSRDATNIIEWGASCVIIDEAHRLSTLKAKRTEAILGHNSTGLNCAISKARYVWPLTGTPVIRYYDGLYPLLRALAYPLLKQYGAQTKILFTDVFCVSEKYKISRFVQVDRTIASINHEVMRDLLYTSGFATNRKLVDVAKNMPPLVERELDVYFEPSPLLTSLQQDALMGDTNELNPALGKAIHQLGIEKAKRVVEYIIEEIPGHDPVLILYWHTDVGEVIHNSLKELTGKVGYRIGGDTDKNTADIYVDLFNKGQAKWIVGQIDAMGESLNLQKGCHRVVVAERPWSYAQIMQAFRRVWRWGQEVHVQVDYLIAPGIPTEELQSRVLERKKETMAEVQQ